MRNQRATRWYFKSTPNMAVNLTECPFCGSKRISSNKRQYECGLYIAHLPDGVLTVHECQNVKSGETLFKINLDAGIL